MDQAIINWIIGLGGTVIGIFIKSMLDSIKDLQRSDKEMAERGGSIGVLVAGTCPISCESWSSSTPNSTARPTRTNVA